MEQWNNHFFSQWVYLSPNMYSPDNHSVYGSMKDYFYLMSDGEFILNGTILNPDNDEDGVPDWIQLPNTKSYYNNHGMYTFSQAAKIAAQNAGLNTSTSSSVKLVIVYAGHTYRTLGGLHPQASGSEYISGERFAMGSPYDQERSDATFMGIGMHCHEFGH